MASDWDTNEIQTGKRTKKYRFFEMLPGLLSYGMIILLFVLSIIQPTLGSIYLLIIITVTLVKAIGVAYRTIQGYNIVKKAEKVNWRKRVKDLETPHKSYERILLEEEAREAEVKQLLKLKKKPDLTRLIKPYALDEHLDNLRAMAVSEDDSKSLVKEDFPKPEDVIHAVIMVAYNEGLDTLTPSVEAVKKTSFPNDRIIFVLGYEERGGAEMEQNAKILKEKFKDTFKDFILVKHPDGLPGEIQGKGPNLCYAGKALQEYCEKRHIKKQNVIVTSLDSDNRMSKPYLDYVAYEFIVRPNRQHLSYQPVSIFMNNIWDARIPMRIIAISNSFFNIISTMRPHTLKNFASHSQPLEALEEMDFWSKRTIVEDGHQYWRSLFYFHGDYEVVPVRVPMYQDAVMEETFWKTLKAQFIQLRRWDYGASDVAFVGVRLFSRDRKTKGKMKFLPLFYKFVRLLEGHVMLAAMSPIVAFGGWVPRLMNFDSRNLLTYNLPNTVSTIQLVASVGLMVTIVVSLRMIPPKPKNPHKISKLIMIVQWVLMPVVAIVYQSAAAFYSQTRLLTGHYMEKFDVTKKVVKKHKI